MTNPHPIVLFDGECNLCNGVVRYIVPLDPSGKLRFANLQSETGMALLEKHSLATDVYDSFILIDGDQAYKHSEGALRVFNYLKFPLPMFARLFALMPFPLRKKVYFWIAGNRYAWFGKTDYCQPPTKSLLARFLP